MNNFLNKYLKEIMILIAVINLLLAAIFKIPCFWKTNFNIECAGCGATRMLESLIHFQIYQAFRYNPLMFSLLFITIIYIIYCLICKIFKINYYLIKDRDLYILLVIIVLFTIFRNIKGFEFLKPTIIK